jgi:hypothetical protein
MTKNKTQAKNKIIFYPLDSWRGFFLINVTINLHQLRRQEGRLFGKYLNRGRGLIFTAKKKTTPGIFLIILDKIPALEQMKKVIFIFSQNP